MNAEKSDALTGAYNRQEIFSILEKWFEEAKGRPRLLALTFVDIDQFKGINDQYGHMFGDQVLKEIAKVLQFSFSKGCLICRFGGDEFLIVSTGVPKAELVERAERARRLIRRIPQRLPASPPPSLAATIGMSFYPRDGLSPRELLKVADIANYRGKNMGGDRIVSD